MSDRIKLLSAFATQITQIGAHVERRNRFDRFGVERCDGEQRNQTTQ